MGRVFANGPGDLGSIPGHVIPKTIKMVLDTSLLNTQQYKVRIKGKVEQSRERSIALPLHLGVVAIEKGALCSPLTTVANFTYYFARNKQKFVSIKKKERKRSVRVSVKQNRRHYFQIPPLPRNFQIFIYLITYFIYIYICFFLTTSAVSV